MNIYIDESGSINNSLSQDNDFVIALVTTKDRAKVERVYKRFVSANLKRLNELDKNARPRKMFRNGKFFELKGFLFDKEMKHRFVDFFTQKPLFQLFYVRMYNYMLDDVYCQNTSRTFNYVMRLALSSFIRHGHLPVDDCILQLDERNEKKETRTFLANYLNTELVLNGTTMGQFEVSYFNSNSNAMIQVADVFSNLFYANLRSEMFEEEIQMLKDRQILKQIYEFPKLSV